MTELEELKLLVQQIPFLEKEYENARICLMEERLSDYDKQENGYVYHVRPSVQNRFDSSQKAYDEAGQRILDLSKQLNLCVNIKGIPNLSESQIKPYERPELPDYILFPNSPIGRP